MHENSTIATVYCECVCACVSAGVHASVCINADEIYFSNFGTFSVFPKERHECSCMHVCMQCKHAYMHTYIHA